MKRTLNAEREAKEVLRRFGFDTPPVPVEELAEKLRVQVVAEPLPRDVSGMLYRRDGRSLIIVNKSHAPLRRRFSIAHELGHYILHPNVEVFVNQVGRQSRESIEFRDSKSSLGTDLKEMEANRFAAELLMPRDWVLKESERLRPLLLSPRDFEQFSPNLAKTFRVSPEAMKFRLVNLGVLGSV